MQAFTRLSGPVLVLPADNIDTDQIIPARFLTATDFEGMGEHAFADWRFAADGQTPTDHVLNQRRARHSPMLVAGRNFGCGSSREHAPQALLGFGFRVIISSQIADIFKANSQTIGLLPVEVDAVQHDRLLNMDGEQITVDLETCEILVRNADGLTEHWAFEIDPFARHCLLRGQDKFDFLDAADDAIRLYEEARNR